MKLIEFESAMTRARVLVDIDELAHAGQFEVMQGGQTGYTLDAVVLHLRSGHSIAVKATLGEVRELKGGAWADPAPSLGGALARDEAAKAKGKGKGGGLILPSEPSDN
jgi:hypothetical protein